ncbi:MAG: UDP-N-acetylglucosamine--undecaprenyl-phosphate N-acetylglucosaminephosphotransferase [Vibrio sp.]
MLIQLITAVLLSFFYLVIFRKIAQKIGLVDNPNARKLHQGSVPLVGGVSIFFTIMSIFVIFYDIHMHMALYMFSAAVLVIIGVVDDKYDISFKFRLYAQTAISCLIIAVGERSLHNFGDLLGDGQIFLPEMLSYIVTILAIVGAINAFNMVDGIDGLLGGLACVSFASLALMFYLDGNLYFSLVCLIFIAATIPYVVLNLGSRLKVFMGDAGSIFIGFTVIWMLIAASQLEPHQNVVSPVTALWFIAIPLMDMAAIMIRRVKKGQSPFKPDREHLHHICQRAGMSPRQSLLFIVGLATVCASIGVWGELANAPEVLMFLLFMGLCVCYLFAMLHVWKLVSFIRRMFGMEIKNIPADS